MYAGADRRRAWAAALVAGIALLAVASAAVPRPADAAFPGGQGQIVFSSGPKGSFDTSIWVMAANGTGRTQLTSFGPGSDRTPAWSPDGTKIAFVRRLDADGLDYVWTMDANGANATQLGLGEWPAWSPSGTEIVFVVVDRPAGELPTSAIWTMHANGTGRTLVTDHQDARIPVWSPDGSRIAYGIDAAGGLSGEIRTIKPDGTADLHLHTTTLVPAPDWSPDALRLAFADHAKGGRVGDVLTMPATGGPIVDVTGSHSGLPTTLTAPAYSPDGDRLVFEGRTPPAATDLYVVDADGSGTATNLTKTPTISEATPDWQPTPPYPFGDIATSRFVTDIVWLEAAGLTSGCAPVRYCPTRTVSRGEVASFLVRVFGLARATTDYFGDDDGTTHERDINALFAAGITRGCAADRFCPNDPITRAQLATLFARAYELPASATDVFTDDDGSPHEGDIDALAAAGIAKGCGPTTFCPSADVTRGQIAAFLHRADGFVDDALTVVP